MNNSIKFTREGGSISFYTEVMVKSDSSRYIKFELIDNGVGIE
jgi:signal transduction histidine kinase